MLGSAGSVVDRRHGTLPGGALDATPGGPSASSASGDPADSELDALQELGDEITTLCAHLHAATHRLLTLIREFDRRRGWEPGGYRSCADWLAFRTGIDLGAAREKVRAAHALERLPRVSAAMARGELSFSKVRAITRVAEPDTEGELLEYARCATAAQLERLIRSWRTSGRHDEAELERRRHRTRRFSVVPDGEGMYVVRGRLDPEVGVLLMRAVEAASDALYRTEPPAEGEVVCELERPDPAQRRADAVGLLAERALAAGFGGEEVEEEVSAETSHPGISAETRAEQREAASGRKFDPEVSAETSHPRISAGTRAEQRQAGNGRPSRREISAETPAPPGSGPSRARPPGVRSNGTRRLHLSGTRAERYQVLVHVDAATLARDGEPGRSELEDGTRLSAETARRLACDGAVVRVVRGADGAVLDVGRKTRTVTPAIRRALRVRDGGCRFPGCGSRFTDAHHLVHWADGGRTSLDQTLSLCRFHHRLVHEGGFTVTRATKGHVLFWDQRGRPVAVAPPRLTAPARLTARGGGAGGARGAGVGPAGDHPATRLVRDNRERGVVPDGLTAGARYRRSADIPFHVVAGAEEAVCAAR